MKWTDKKDNLLVRSHAVDFSGLTGVQLNPIEIDTGLPGAAPKVKVDAAIRLPGRVVVIGWRIGSIQVGLVSAEQALLTRITTVSREDVGKHFKCEGADLGFILVADVPDEMPVSISWSLDGLQELGAQQLVLKDASEIGPSEHTQLGAAIGLLALSETPHSREWRNFVALAPRAEVPAPDVKGYLEMAASIQGAGNALVVGWVAAKPGGTVWLEDEKGNTYSLDSAFRKFRRDVQFAVGPDYITAAVEAGFIQSLVSKDDIQILRLVSLSELGVHLISEVKCVVLPPDPAHVARWLFGIHAPPRLWPERINKIDAPVIDRLIEKTQSNWSGLPVISRQLGDIAVAPRISVIVPLYGRYDFVESQLLMFASDPAFKALAELVYVIDDPEILERFQGEIESLYMLYGVPVRWVWGGVNRGFSGANNLGVSVAKGDVLLFLNSDVFPQCKGWLEPMLDLLDKRRDVMAVGPRLVFAEGSIQHAGMAFLRVEELGIWANTHPGAGLDPILDPCSEPTCMPAVTGACLMMRRADFDRVGGWDTGYLIGDFEDSDLCLKLRQFGGHVVYLPTVQLTHLERQSFSLLGAGDFRQRVTLFNAARHQLRWGEWLSQPFTPHALPREARKA